MNTQSIIQSDHISIHFGETAVLSDVSFSIKKGDFVGLAGPNGAGKTTLVKALLGLIPHTEGSISLFGSPLQKFREWQRIGYLPQKISSINSHFPATVHEIIKLGLLSGKNWPKAMTNQDSIKTENIMAELEIENLRNKLFFELSGGQQQKVLLARALVAGPELLIFDEPSTALDPESRDSFYQLIKRLNKDRHITVILITHDTGYIGSYADTLLYLDKHLVYFGKFSDFCRSKQMNSYFGEEAQHMICHQHV